MTTLEWIGAAIVVLGVPFFLLGSLGLLRFPDVYTRIHALAKADNVGLGLVCLGLGVYSASLVFALKLALIWLLMVIASSIGAGLVARAAAVRGVKPWEP